MIQRVQTLYLLLTLIALVALSFGLDFLTVEAKVDNQYEVYSHGNVKGVQKDVILKGELTEENMHALRLAVDKADIEPQMMNVSTYSFPFYIGTILLSLLTISTILSYKKLKRQQQLARLVFVLNLIMFFVVVIASDRITSSVVPGISADQVVSKLDTGFYFLCIAVAFSFMALLGIRRDVKIISSLDRLR